MGSVDKEEFEDLMRSYSSLQHRNDILDEIGQEEDGQNESDRAREAEEERDRLRSLCQEMQTFIASHCGSNVVLQNEYKFKSKTKRREGREGRDGRGHRVEG